MDTTIGANNKRALQVKACRKDGWTKARRQLFLDTLAQTCNVRLSSQAAGVLPPSSYMLRRRDPAFAALWREALSRGYDRLEEALLSHALQNINDIAIADGDCDIFSLNGKTGRDTEAVGAASAGSAPRASDNTVRLALALLDRHRKALDGTGRVARGPRKVPPATAEATDAALRKKLDALAQKLKAQRPQDSQ